MYACKRIAVQRNHSLENYENEYKLIMSIPPHPRIIKFYQVFKKENEMYYIVMEKADESLFEKK